MSQACQTNSAICVSSALFGMGPQNHVEGNSVGRWRPSAAGQRPRLLSRTLLRASKCSIGNEEVKVVMRYY
jgi:hypothetical protein